MAKIKIKGWDSGINKIKMTDILIDRLSLEKDQAEELLKAVSAGKVITLDIEGDGLAANLADELAGVGALIETE